MNTIHLVLAILLILGIIYIFLKMRYSNVQYIAIENFGEQQKQYKSLLLNDLRHKLFHRNVSFWFYIISLTFTFIIIVIIIYSIFGSTSQNIEPLKGILFSSSGGLITAGFRKLYLKNDRDISILRDNIFSIPD